MPHGHTIFACDHFLIEDVKPERALGHIPSANALIKIDRVLIGFVDLNGSPQTALVNRQGQRSRRGSAEYQSGIVVRQRTHIRVTVQIERTRVNGFLGVIPQLIPTAENSEVPPISFF